MFPRKQHEPVIFKFQSRLGFQLFADCLADSFNAVIGHPDHMKAVGHNHSAGELVLCYLPVTFQRSIVSTLTFSLDGMVLK